MNVYVDKIWFSFSLEEKQSLMDLSDEMKTYFEENCEPVSDFFSLEFEEEEDMTTLMLMLEGTAGANSPKVPLLEKLQLIAILNGNP